MSRRNLFLASAAVLGFAFASISPATVQAETDVDLRGGVYTDMEAPALGGGLLMRVGDTPWMFNPNVEFAFDDNDTGVALSGDFHYDIPTAGSLSPYVGAGPTILFDENDNDFGVNVLGGVAGKMGEVRPFGQLKAILGGNNELALMGGIRF
jgi:hypothetical protein